MSTTKSAVLLEHYLKTLKLPTMLREHAKLAALCQQERADYQAFLLRLAERELADRELRAAERRVKAAKFPVVKTLDSFDFSAQPSINQELVRELASGEYIDRRENLLLVGNSGTGKTHLATALGFAACQHLPAGTARALLHGHRLSHPASGAQGRAADGEADGAA